MVVIAGSAVVLIAGGEDFTLRDALPIADPALDLGNPLKGPFKAIGLDWAETAAAALELARIAGILPAFLVDPQDAGEAQPFAPADLAALTDPARLVIAARAHLPAPARWRPARPANCARVRRP